MTTATLEKKPAPIARNGVDVPMLFATINAVGEQPAAAKFQFRAKSKWVSGTHSQTVIGDYFGAGAEQDRDGKTFTVDADHTTVLCGRLQRVSLQVSATLHLLAVLIFMLLKLKLRVILTPRASLVSTTPFVTVSKRSASTSKLRVTHLLRSLRRSFSSLLHVPLFTTFSRTV